MSKWSDFYKDRVGWLNDYQGYFSRRYRPFITTIVRGAKSYHAETILEVGAGIGSTSQQLHQFTRGWSQGTKIFASDNDPEMLALMRRNVSSNVMLVEHDATQPWHNHADVVHSHGLLEHFDNETIRQVIEAHRTAKLQVHYVPGQYDTQSFGDERLMSVQSWQNICSPDQILVFNDGKDYALIFEGR